MEEDNARLVRSNTALIAKNRKFVLDHVDLRARVSRLERENLALKGCGEVQGLGIGVVNHALGVAGSKEGADEGIREKSEEECMAEIEKALEEESFIVSGEHG